MEASSLPLARNSAALLGGCNLQPTSESHVGSLNTHLLTRSPGELASGFPRRVQEIAAVLWVS
jgi:hypothetical protein